MNMTITRRRFSGLAAGSLCASVGGYLTQLNSERLLQEGHLGYERVWSCPDIDMIYAPAKYGTLRSFEGAKVEELFDGGETAIENGRFTLARQAGIMKLYLFVGGEASPATKG